MKIPRFAWFLLACWLGGIGFEIGAFLYSATKSYILGTPIQLDENTYKIGFVFGGLLYLFNLVSNLKK